MCASLSRCLPPALSAIITTSTVPPRNPPVTGIRMLDGGLPVPCCVASSLPPAMHVMDHDVIVVSEITVGRTTTSGVVTVRNVSSRRSRSRMKESLDERSTRRFSARPSSCRTLLGCSGNSRSRTIMRDASIPQRSMKTLRRCSALRLASPEETVSIESGMMAPVSVIVACGCARIRESTM